MKENFLSCNTFPFAFNPENPISRSAKWNDEKVLVISFDMTVTNCPECAAVALILTQSATKKLKFIANSNGNKKPNIFLELKSGKEKYFETLVIENEEMEVEICENTSEIVFTCWHSANEDYKGDITISFE